MKVREEREDLFSTSAISIDKSSIKVKYKVREMLKVPRPFKSSKTKALSLKRTSFSSLKKQSANRWGGSSVYAHSARDY